MSVDYSSVMIYGYKIPASKLAKYKLDHLKMYEIIEELSGNDNDYKLISDNDYCDPDNYYFGITLASGLVLDQIDAICWHEYDKNTLEDAFVEYFGSLDVAEIGVSQIYHFVRIY